jgi:hypothetical protein
MDTPEAVIEMLFRIDEAYAPQPAPLQDHEPHIG